MSVLTLDVGGPNEMSVDCQRAGHAAPRRVGGKQFPASGSELPEQIRGEFMVVPVVLSRLPEATVATIRDLFAIGRQVNCAGDVFVNGGATALWSGKITDELEETADQWTISLTLFEVAGITGYTPAVSRFLLTSVDSPDSSDPTIALSTPDGSYPGDFNTGYFLLNAVTVPDGDCVAPSTPELSWLSVPLNAGIATGTPYVRMETAMSGVYSGTTVWAVMDFRVDISQVRSDGMGGFTTVAGPYATNYVGVSLGGNLAILSAPGPVILTIATGDQMLVELYPRLCLQPGESDNSQRQIISYGTVPGPRPLPELILGGFITSL